jgi:hypothetical protein
VKLFFLSLIPIQPAAAAAAAAAGGRGNPVKHRG